MKVFIIWDHMEKDIVQEIYLPHLDFIIKNKLIIIKHIKIILKIMLVKLNLNPNKIFMGEFKTKKVICHKEHKLSQFRGFHLKMI